jgi:transcriptional regulator with XRE-family HTH domain
MPRTSIDLPPMAADALRVLGTQIATARRERGWTQAHLASVIGVSTLTAAAIEKGKPSVAIGNVFKAAVVLGISLFGVEDRAEMARLRRRGEERLALIAQRVRPGPESENPDDFDF